MTNPPERTYRSRLTSVMVFGQVYTESLLVTVFVLLAAFSLLGLPLWLMLIAMAIPVPVAYWRAATLGVTADGESLVIRNPWRTYRLAKVKGVRVGYPIAMNRVGCLAFVDHDGRVVNARAATLWYQGFFRERPGATLRRVDDFFRPWAERHLSRLAQGEYEAIALRWRAGGATQ